MGKIERFEDIKAWQKARLLVKEIYKISSSQGFTHDYGLKNQIRRAAVSIMANIAEGFGRRSNHEFANFLNYAHGSVAEVQSHLYIALDVDYLEQSTFHKLYQMSEEVLKMILGLERTHKLINS